MRLLGSRVGPVRAATIALCAVVAVAALATIVLDTEEEPFGSRDRLLASFSAGYECADARDQLTADDLEYRLRYEPERWIARVEVSIARADLKGPCSLRLGVPPGARDAGGANVSLERDGSPSSGIVTVAVGGRDDDYAMEVVLPRDYDMFHSLGFGKYFFEFDFFAPGEGRSFKLGSVEVRLPEGYSVLEALPGGGREPSERTRVWSLKADRDQRAAVTFRHDRLRQAVDLAPEVAFGAVVSILLLLSLPQRREETTEAERAVEPLPPATAPEPAPPLTAPPATEPEPIPAPGPSPAEPIPAPAPAAAPEPQPQLPAPQPQLPAPQPQLPTPKPQLPAPQPSRVGPPPPPERRAARAGAIGLALLAAAVVVRAFRRRAR